MSDHTRVALIAHEPPRTAPRTGGVSSTERTSPGCVIARIAVRQSTTRRKRPGGTRLLH